MNGTMYFYNYSDEPFTAYWDKVPYTVGAKDKIMLQEFLARHIAKHFTDKMMLADSRMVNHFTRKEYLAKCLFDGEPAMTPVQAEVIAMNTNEKKKVGRPKKVQEPTEAKETPQFE